MVRQPCVLSRGCFYWSILTKDLPGSECSSQLDKLPSCYRDRQLLQSNYFHLHGALYCSIKSLNGLYKESILHLSRMQKINECTRRLGLKRRGCRNIERSFIHFKSISFILLLRSLITHGIPVSRESSIFI